MNTARFQQCWRILLLLCGCQYALLLTAQEPTPSAKETRQFSGVYPHLASFNSQGECGTGAIVPWADRLWWITYSPHEPQGSDDKLYSVNQALELTIQPESVGGTPANRMIHNESQQLFIGPYVIDATGKVRVIQPKQMIGRLTGTSRHLTEPAKYVYYATMEEGFYQVDVQSLAVQELFTDANYDRGANGQLTPSKDHGGKLLPGYHGKGLFTGQGRLIYANNGEYTSLARTRPDIPSGVLAEWTGQGDWKVIRRNQFTEVSGPGGIAGNSDPQNDPVWSIGWDHRSLILMCLDQGQWHSYRLPKASHCYDGAHGWNTEWPRIREIGTGDLLMTMHGQFWKFPRTFTPRNSAGITPRSSYLRVIGDFTPWRDQVVMACDDAAKNEFLNTRKAKGKVAGPAASQSNLWFLPTAQLDQFGPALGHGGVWIKESVTAQEPSDPFLFSGFEQRSLCLQNHSDQAVTFTLQVDRVGNGTWTELQQQTVAANQSHWVQFTPEQQGTWLRLLADRTTVVTAVFEYRQPDRRQTTPSDMFAGLSHVECKDFVGGLVRAGSKTQGLQVLAHSGSVQKHQVSGYYELQPNLELKRIESSEQAEWMQQQVAIPKQVLQVVGNSILYIDDDGQRFRLPLGNDAYLKQPELLNQQRTSREVATERDLFQAAGIFYELPARNAGGFAKLRPIATHPFFIQDYCSWRGLLVLTGIDPTLIKNSDHVIKSADQRAAVWLGAIDDLWSLGKARGHGGPWTKTKVAANLPSDPFLFTGFDRQQLTLSHDQTQPVTIKIEVDITGTGQWVEYKSIVVPAGSGTQHQFPVGFQAYWIRFRADRDCVASAEMLYE